MYKFQIINDDGTRKPFCELNEIENEIILLRDQKDYGFEISVTPPVENADSISVINAGRYKGIFKKKLVQEYYVELVLPYADKTWMLYGEIKMTFPPDKKWILYGEIFKNFDEIEEIISNFVIQHKLPDYARWPSNPVDPPNI